MLEYLRDHDDIECGVLERKRLVEVGPHCLDSSLARAGKGHTVDVDPDDAIPRQIRTRQRPVAAPQVQHPQSRPTDPLAKQRDALRSTEHEPPTAPVLMVAPVLLLYGLGLHSH